MKNFLTILLVKQSFDGLCRHYQVTNIQNIRAKYKEDHLLLIFNYSI